MAFRQQDRAKPSGGQYAVQSTKGVSCRCTQRAEKVKKGISGLFAAAAVLAMLVSCGAPESFKGTDLGKMPEADFALSDTAGHAVQLAGLRGSPVVLTFVYSQCLDVCPLIAHKLSQVYAALGADSQRVKFVAVSTAPELDTPISIARFAQAQGMDGKWIYLNGTRAQLEPVWASYFIGADAAAQSGAQVNHQSRVILIDALGQQRVNYDPDFAPEDVTHDLKLLLNGN